MRNENETSGDVVRGRPGGRLRADHGSAFTGLADWESLEALQALLVRWARVLRSS